MSDLLQLMPNGAPPAAINTSRINRQVNRPKSAAVFKGSFLSEVAHKPYDTPEMPSMKTSEDPTLLSESMISFNTEGAKITKPPADDWTTTADVSC